MQKMQTRNAKKNPRAILVNATATADVLDYLCGQTAQLPPHLARKEEEEEEIKGPSGSVRGHKDLVRRHLARFSREPEDDANDRCGGHRRRHMTGETTSARSRRHTDRLGASDLRRMRAAETDLCVLYTTSLGVVRRSFEDSKLMRSIMELNRIGCDERDIYLNAEFREQLRLRCGCIAVPTMFVGGERFGGVKELEQLNESGMLGHLFGRFKVSRPPSSSNRCGCCGNAKFIACQKCNGSGKSAFRHLRFSSVVLKCAKCADNDGLVACPTCCCASERIRATGVVHGQPVVVGNERNNKLKRRVGGEENNNKDIEDETLDADKSNKLFSLGENNNYFENNTNNYDDNDKNKTNCCNIINDINKGCGANSDYED